MKILIKIFSGLVGLIVLLFVFLWFDMQPNIPDQGFDLQRPTMTGDKHVLIFGATRNTGYEVAEDLMARGDKVTAFVRESSDRSLLEVLGADFVVGDALDAASVQAAFAAGEYDAVVTTMGSISAPVPPDYQGNANVFDAAVASGVQRVIMVSTVGAGDSLDAAPRISRVFLSKVIPLKTQAEDHLMASGLDYTIIRPGGLPPGVGTGGGILSEDRSTMGFIVRSDLARLIVAALDNDSTIGKVFAAVDPAQKSPIESLLFGSDSE
jgi:nucleoside-diphosphate-sugar epimerase